MKKFLAIGLAGGFVGALLVLPNPPAPRYSAALGRVDKLQRKAACASRAIHAPGQPKAADGVRRLVLVGQAARLEKIRRDYEELRLQALHDYGAAGEAYPGGLYAFLRVLALLERERRSDLAAVLPPDELEALEWRETSAGQHVARALGATRATVEQRRALFRLERDFEARFEELGAMTPALFLERERARQQTQDEIHAILGDLLFEAWLAAEDSEYARASAFAAAHGLSPGTPNELRHARNEFFLRQLELNAASGLSAEEREANRLALVRHVEARARAILGPVLLQTARAELLGWLPQN